MLDNCGLTNTDLTHLFELIPNMPSLEVFDLSYNQFTRHDDDFLKVLQQLSHSNVTTLKISGAGFCCLMQSNSRHDYISALKSLIDPSSGRLQELTAGDDGDYDDGTLASLLSPPSSLRTLHLWAPNLCFSHFEDNTCLTTLCIEVTHWSDLQLPAVVKIVKHNKTLLYMKLMSFQDYPIPETEEHYDHVVSAIAAALQGNRSLKLYVTIISANRNHSCWTKD